MSREVHELKQRERFMWFIESKIKAYKSGEILTFYPDIK